MNKNNENIVYTNLYDYLKATGQAHNFHCRICGEFMLDENHIQNLIIRARKDKVEWFDSNLSTKYIENDINRWLVKGYKINDKIFRRNICWKCYCVEAFTFLKTFKSVAKLRLRDNWLSKISYGKFAIPGSDIGSAPKHQLSILFNVSEEEIETNSKKYITASLESFIKRHGKKLGEAKYKEYCERQKYTTSQDYFAKTRGWDEHDFAKFNSSRATTLENLILKHGEELGTIRWETYCERQAYVGVKKEYFIEKYGDKEGLIRYDKMLKQKIKGAQKSKKNYSKIATKLFESIDYTNQDFLWNSQYAPKSSNEKSIPKLDGEGFYLLDYVYKDKVIEFNGDFWHANPEIYKPDDVLNIHNSHIKASDIWRNDLEKHITIRKDYNLLVVWEKDFRENPEKIVQECVDFLLK